VKESGAVVGSRVDSAMGSSGDGPLAGVLALDLGQGAVGPVAASYLAMLGATVIKVEAPLGDATRFSWPRMGGTGMTYLSNNVGKFGVVLDLKEPRDKRRAISLISRADVLIENFRSPEVMTRLGLDYFDVLSKVNPGLIYLQSSAFGSSGPWNGMVSFEWIAQAACGFAGSTGLEGGLPELSRGTAFLDWNGAMVNVVAALAGLHYRERTGHGLMLETSQFGSAVFTSLTRLVEMTDAYPHGSRGTGVVPDRAFVVADGFITVCAPTDATWVRLCRAIDRADLADHQEWSTAVGRWRDGREVEKELAKEFAKWSQAEWVKKLREAKVPCAAHRWPTTMATLIEENEQVLANDMVEQLETWAGRLLSQSPHWQLSERPLSLKRPAPKLGEHTELVCTLVDRWQRDEGLSGVETPLGRSEPVGPTRHRRTRFSGERPLGGMKVLEIGGGLVLGVAGMVLAQLGADVHKIEPPGGDWLRTWGGERDGPLWKIVSENKHVDELDLGNENDRDTAMALVRRSDVALVCGTPGTRRRLSVDRPGLHAINPSLIYCGISGWGMEGPLAEQPATELDVQTAVGMNLMLGPVGGDPVRQGFEFVSMNTGFAAVQAVLAVALARRHDSITRPEHIEISMLQTAVALLQWNVAAESDPDSWQGKPLEGYSQPQDHGYACRDGRFLFSFRGDEDAWTNLLLALDQSELLSDERFNTVEHLRAYEYLLPALLEPTLVQRSYAELEQLILQASDGAVVPILTPTEVRRHPQTAALNFIDESRDGRNLRMSLPITVVHQEG
jgi:CoA:oxalate CoA-transferase